MSPSVMRTRAVALASAVLVLGTLATTGCTSTPKPSASAMETPALVAPVFTPLAPGSPVATMPNLSPTSEPTPEPTPEPTSPLPKTLGEWASSRQASEDDGSIDVFYRKTSNPALLITAALKSSNKSDAQLGTLWPGTKRYGKAWCAPQDTPTTFACVVKVEPGKAVLALSTDVGVDVLAPFTEGLAAGL